MVNNMTRDEQTRAVVAAVFVELLNKGYSVDKAYDKIFGEHAYRTLADEIWTINQQRERAEGSKA